jgi:hypothetical protein
MLDVLLIATPLIMGDHRLDFKPRIIHGRRSAPSPRLASCSLSRRFEAA